MRFSSGNVHRLKMLMMSPNWARKCVFMETQTIFEEFEVLNDEELMGISGGSNINFQSYISSVLSDDVIGNVYDR